MVKLSPEAQAGAKAQILGVPSKDLKVKMATVLQMLGCHHAPVVHGADGLDEITITGKTFVAELQAGKIINYEITPEDVGLSRAAPESLKGGTAKENAVLLLSILSGRQGPQRDIVVMNAADALIAGDKAAGFKEGVVLAGAAIDSGKALQKGEELIAFSQNPVWGSLDDSG